jgi:hypothetical protein
MDRRMPASRHRLAEGDCGGRAACSERWMTSVMSATPTEGDSTVRKESTDNV